MNEEIVLTPKEILEKDFKIDARGYRPQEVDKFLDLVIRDYSEFSSIKKRQNNEIALLTDENEKLKAEIRSLRGKLDVMAEKAGKEITNVDLIKRISDLEKAVFGGE